MASRVKAHIIRLFTRRQRLSINSGGRWISEEKSILLISQPL